MRRWYFILIVVFFGQCTSARKDETITTLSNNDDSFKSILIDTVIVQPETFSGVGFFEMNQDTILFYDKMFGTVSKFDVDGNYHGRSLGMGNGPAEIPSIVHAIEGSNGTHILLEKTWVYDVFSANWQKLKRKTINWNETASLQEMESNPTGDMQGIYEIEYQTKPKAWGHHEIIIGITTDHPKFNSYFTDSYYQDSRVFAVVDIRTGIVLDMFGRRSNVFLQKKYIPNFDVVHFDIDAEHILATFEADSLVYVIDRKGNVTASFGRRGRDMNTEYALTSSFDDAEAQIVRDRKQYGYYTDVKYLPEAGLVVRSYQRGSHVRYDGLQVYRDKELVGDFDVPKGTRVIGYSNGRAVAEGIKDERNNRLGYYLLTFL